MRRFALVLCCAAGWLTSSVTAAADFRAGAAVADITPVEWPMPLVGTFSERLATQAWDPLSARAIVLDDGTTKLAITVADSCFIPRSVFDEAKKRASAATGIPADHMLTSATHTHTAPPSRDTSYADASAPYVERLTAGIAEAIVRANGRLEPAKIAWGVVAVPDEVFNRRWYMKPGGIEPNPFGELTDQVRMNPPVGSAFLIEPAGPTDPDVSWIALKSLDGRPLALLANYSLHYVGGIPEGGASADYFAEFARQIGARLAPDNAEFVGIMSNGTSGDVNNIPRLESRPSAKPFERIRAVASRVADAVAASHQSAEYRDSVTLAMAQRELTLNLRRPTEAQIARAKAFLAEEDESKLPRRAQPYARMTLALAERAPTEAIVLQAIRIGELGISAIPCEVFAETGLEIKAESPLKPTFTIELANGHYSYLPTPRQHRLGGYETWMGTNILEITASDKITATVLELLDEVQPGAKSAAN